jgi:hypothetical protein
VALWLVHLRISLNGSKGGNPNVTIVDQSFKEFCLLVIQTIPPESRYFDGGLLSQFPARDALTVSFALEMT